MSLTARATAIDAIIGRNVQAARTTRGFGQKALAEAIGVSFQQLQKYEIGRDRLSASRLVAIATALELPIIELFAGTPSAPDLAAPPVLAPSLVAAARILAGLPAAHHQLAIDTLRVVARSARPIEPS